MVKFDNGGVHKYDLIVAAQAAPGRRGRRHKLPRVAALRHASTPTRRTPRRQQFVYMHTMVQNSEKRARGEDRRRQARRGRAAPRQAHGNEGAPRRVPRDLRTARRDAEGISFAANEATKESHVREGGVMAALDGEVRQDGGEHRRAAAATGPRPERRRARVALGDDDLVPRPVGARSDGRAGMIGENDTSVEYPTVEETVQVLSFTTLQRHGRRPRRRARREPGGPPRRIRIFNGEATLVATRPTARRTTPLSARAR